MSEIGAARRETLSSASSLCTSGAAISCAAADESISEASSQVATGSNLASDSACRVGMLSARPFSASVRNQEVHLKNVPVSLCSFPRDELSAIPAGGATGVGNNAVFLSARIQIP